MYRTFLLLLVTGFFQIGLNAQSAAKESGGYSIAITEFNYNSDTYNNSGDWLELHNYGGTAINLAGWQVKDATGAGTYTIPGGTTLAPDNYLVIVEWIDTFLMVHPTVTNYIGNMNWNFGNMSGTIRLLDNTGSLVKQINYLDSVPWPKSSDGYGPSVQILDEMAAENNPANWIPGCVLGTPGTDYTPCNYDLVVGEINYNSLLGYNPGDWIELYNRSASSIALSGWTLRDSRNANAFLIPNGTTLGAGSRLVISDSLESFTVKFPGVSNVIGEPDFSFSNGGDAIRLYDTNDKLRYSVRYNDNLPWPEDPDGEGFTLELIDESGNPNLPTAWIAGCLYGSPGTPFIFPCPNSILTFDPAEVIIGPVPFTSSLNISLATGAVMRNISILNVQGQLIHSATPDASFAVWNGQDASGNAVAPGMYLIHITNDAGAVTAIPVVKAL